MSLTYRIILHLSICLTLSMCVAIVIILFWGAVFYMHGQSCARDFCKEHVCRRTERCVYRKDVYASRFNPVRFCDWMGRWGYRRMQKRIRRVAK